MDTDREMDIRIVEILAEHDELERMLILGQLGSRAKRMMENAEANRTGNTAAPTAPDASGNAASRSAY